MNGLKRATDLAIAGPGLVLASPLILFAMIIIRLTSPGPAIYSQIRLARGAARFRCYKLRTMYIDTPSVPTHEAAKSFITPIGNILRRFKIDELPQLWNVLKGEMSLVGPRPCLPSQDQLIEHRERLGLFGLRPGVTGLAQVRNIDMSNPLLCAETDAEYLRTMSLRLDFRILVRTLLRV